MIRPTPPTPLYVCVCVAGSICDAARMAHSRPVVSKQETFLLCSFASGTAPKLKIRVSIIVPHEIHLFPRYLEKRGPFFFLRMSVLMRAVLKMVRKDILKKKIATASDLSQ